MIFTIGHSNHAIERLVELLRLHEIEVVTDVRSIPYSRRNPQFKKDALRTSLKEHGFQYLHIPELGGKPRAPVDQFRAALERVIEGSSEYRVALLCAEENPENCHRRLLITPALRERGFTVTHIRATGELVADDELDDPQGELF